MARHCGYQRRQLSASSKRPAPKRDASIRDGFSPISLIDQIRHGVHLSPRETKIVEMVAHGIGNKQIGGLLNLTEGTVKQYLYRAFRVLHIPSRHELMVKLLALQEQEIADLKESRRDSE